MKDFLIRSDVNKTGKAAQVFASVATKRIEITNWANRFTAQELQPLEEWILEYYDNYNQIITITLENAWSSFPYVPKENMKFEQLYTYYDNTVYSPIAKIINSLPVFNLRLKGMNPHTSPRIIADAEFGVIQLAGNSFTSLHIETYQPFFAWLEKFLSVPGKNIRVEFWMEYFNSSSSKSLLEVLDVFTVYKRSHKGNVNAYWYYQKHDSDMLEDGKEMQEDSGLKIKFLGLDQKKWKEMYSNI